MAKLVFDLDGVIITYGRNFAETYSDEFGIGVGEIFEFFSKDYYECAVGRSNLRDKIKKYISPWKWPGDVDSLIKYWFDAQSTIDDGLLALIASARASGHECYVASDQDAMRSDHVQRLFDLHGTFDGAFFSFEIGAMKSEPVFFERVLTALQCAPGEVFFWDDNPKNVAIAKQVGINSEVYRTYREFELPFSKRFLGLARAR